MAQFDYSLFTPLFPLFALWKILFKGLLVLANPGEGGSSEEEMEVDDEGATCDIARLFRLAGTQLFSPEDVNTSLTGPHGLPRSRTRERQNGKYTLRCWRGGSLLGACSPSPSLGTRKPLRQNWTFWSGRPLSSQERSSKTQTPRAVGITPRTLSSTARQEPNSDTLLVSQIINKSSDKCVKSLLRGS